MLREVSLEQLVEEDVLTNDMERAIKIFLNGLSILVVGKAQSGKTMIKDCIDDYLKNKSEKYIKISKCDNLVTMIETNDDKL